MHGMRLFACLETHLTIGFCRKNRLNVTGNALNIEYYFWWHDYCFGLLIDEERSVSLHGQYQ